MRSFSILLVSGFVTFAFAINAQAQIDIGVDAAKKRLIQFAKANDVPTGESTYEEATEIFRYNRQFQTMFQSLMALARELKKKPFINLIQSDDDEPEIEISNLWDYFKKEDEDQRNYYIGVVTSTDCSNGYTYFAVRRRDGKIYQLFDHGDPRE